MMTGRDVDAAEAFRIGLADRLVPADDVVRASCDFAELILRNDPMGVQLTKSALLASQDSPSLTAAIGVENRNQALMIHSGAVPAGLERFRRSRTPRHPTPNTKA